MKLKELFETTKTKTKAKAKVDFDPLKPQKDQPLTTKKPEEKKAEKAEKELTGVSREKTAKATSKIALGDKAFKHLANLSQNVKVGKEENLPSTELKSTELLKPEDVKQVIKNALKVAGVETPDWHTVANLPGNASRAIQTLGKALFASLTTTPTGKVTMIGNVGGQGPNTTSEINAVVNYLRKHGDDLGPGEIDFDAIMPGYKAKVHHFTADGVRFMVVKDDFGQYIYTWPERTSLTGKAGPRALK